MKTTGTIDLSASRVISGQVPISKLFTIDFKSDDLSGDTDWKLKQGTSEDDMGYVQNNGSDEGGTLVSGQMASRTYEGQPGIYFEIEFQGATTGEVAYTIKTDY